MSASDRRAVTPAPRDTGGLGQLIAVGLLAGLLGIGGVVVAEPGAATPRATAPAAANRSRGPVSPYRTAARPRASAPASAPATAQAGQGTPKFRCDELVYTFPDAWSGVQIEHAFIVRNDGDAPLQILEVRPSCGCTVAKDYDKTIPPGGQGKIPLSLRTARVEGVIQKRVSVRTNDPTQQNVTIEIKGKLTPYITVDPAPTAAWGQLAPAIDLTKTLKITNNTDTPLKLEPAPPRPKAVFTAAVKELQPGKVYEVKVTATGPFQDGFNSEQLELNTGLPQQEHVTISCSLYKAPPIVVTPTQFRLPGPVAREYKRQIIVTYNEEGQLKLLSATCSDPRIKTEVTEVKPGKDYRVTVTIPQGYEMEANRSAQVEIKTDYQKQPIFTIQILAPPTTRAPATRTTQPAGRQVEAGSLLGRPAPQVAIKSADGKQIQLGERGQVTVLNLWASWSAASQQQVSLLRELAQTYRRKGVQFVNVSVDQLTPPAEVTAAAERLDMAQPIGLDTKGAVASQYGVSNVPMLVLIGRGGTIEVVQPGGPATPEQSAALAEQLGAKLDVLLAGKTHTDFPESKPVPGLINDVVAARPAPRESPVPILMVESPRQDLGPQKPNRPTEYDLFLRNDGQQPLLLEGVTGTTGVDVDPGYPRQLGPGVVGSVRCKFTTPSTPQSFAHQVTIASNDPARPSLSITLSGRSLPFIEVVPPTGVDFSNKPRTHTIPRIATLTYHGEGAVKYEPPESSSPKFEAELKPTRAPMHTMIIVKSKPPLDAGENKAVIRVKTDCPQQPVVEVPVRLFLPPRIQADPPSVEVVPSKRLQKTTVEIYNHGAKSLNILGVQASNEDVHTQFFPQPDGMSYKLELTLPAAPHAVYTSGNQKITIRTDDQEFGEIVIPIQTKAGEQGGGKVASKTS